MAERLGWRRDSRAVTPAVGKTLELGLVVVFTALLTTVLLGGVVPSYRTAASAELGERVLASAANDIEASVPPTLPEVNTTRKISLPTTLRESTYTLTLDGRWLVLDHPRRGVGGRVRLALPDRVDRIEGRWRSGGRTLVRVRDAGDGLVVELVTAEGR